MFVLAACSALAACSQTTLDGRAAGTIEVPEGTTKVRVTLEKGSLSVFPSADDAIHYEAKTRLAVTKAADLPTLQAVTVELTADQTALRDGLHLVGPRVPAALAQRDPGAAIVMRTVLRVPQGLELELISERGHLGIQDWEGPVSLHTGSGSIILTNISGDVESFTGSGDYVVRDHSGGASLASDHGSFMIYLDRVDPEAGVSIRAKHGNVICNVAPGQDFELEMETEMGVVETQFVPIEVDGLGGRAAGTVGTGGGLLELRSERGNLSARITPQM